MTSDDQIQLSKVHVTLGLKADGACPEVPGDALGHVTVGLNGFMNLLETQLGIPSSDVSFTTRLIQYLSCVEGADHKDAFYHASYEADPFSVARTLLKWRDQWYLAGWDGTFDSEVPKRLSDMAAIESHAVSEVELGLGQRVQAIIELLKENSIAIESIHLLDKLTDFPILWRRLIEAIDVSVSDAIDIVPQAENGTDLSKLQQQLLTSSDERIELAGDGSVVVLHADTALESSQLTARIAQQSLSGPPNETLAILAEKRGDVLDEALEGAGAPRLGYSALSPWRPVFQVLPLAFELLWTPLSPTALFQFLSHPVGPIPARIRERLAQTVAKVPGIGSAEWEEALSKCIENEEEAARERHEQNIQYWLESPRFPPDPGVDNSVLSERAQRVADWLQGAVAVAEDNAKKALYFIALNQALEFVQAINRLAAHGRTTLTRDNVLRLIDDVRGTGAIVADRHAEVVPGQSQALRADHSGAFYNPVDKVVWWDCQATDHVQRWPWSKVERAALADNGVLLQTEDEQLAWLGSAWLRPVLSAKEQCMIILHNDTDRHHPIWDQISSQIDGIIVLNASDHSTAESLSISHTTVEAQPLPMKSRWWQVPSGVELPTRDCESFSSLDAYIHSPYQWLLRYAARIRPGSLATVSDGNLLKGSLAHRLYEEFLNANPDVSAINPGHVSEWVDKHIGALLEQEGARLLEPGRQAERERFIIVLQESLEALVGHLLRARIIQVQMELPQEGTYVGGKLSGFIDLLATRADGHEAVVDIKFGGKSYRRNALIGGSYLQLATYAQLRQGNGAASPPALSYFIVNNSHMLSLNHNVFPEAESIVPSVQEDWSQYWHRFENTWQWRKAQFDKGLIEVTISGTEPTADPLPEEEGLAIPDASDSFNDYEFLTGWGPDE
jgi:ATP-dependent helicase/nuclease subunit B